MSFAGLQERLTALHDSTSQLRTLVDRLAHLTFQPGAAPSLGTEDDEDGGVLGELSAEIAQLLKAGAEEQELLREEANYVRPDGHEKERLVDGVVRVGAELAKLRVAFRKARLQAKKRLVEMQKLERKLLLQSYSAPVPESDPLNENDEPAAATAAATTTQQQVYPRHHQTRSIHQSRSGLSEEEQRTVGASSSVTASLRRAHDLVASELGRSEYAHQTLSESSAALRRLDDSYGSLDSMLGRSRELLGTLLRSQKSDTWYLQTAFYMLATTAAWLVFRRLLYGPLWWLVLLPLRILFGVGGTATRAMLAKGRAPADLAKEGSVGGGAGTEGKREVEGMPDEALPTVKVVSRDGKMDEEEEVVEAVREAVEQAVEQAVEEAEVLEQVLSQPAQDESTGDEEPLVEAQGQGMYASTGEEPVLQRDEL
ncbi:hypothetical protein NHJ13734_006471 [Beauveria thailandica]